jgi:hypothetical protein
MIQFDVAPAIPADYHRLRALTQEEIGHARSAAYVSDKSDPREPVRREGLNNYSDPYLGDDILDWRVRTYIIWFCYIYENLRLIRSPLEAIEEILLEFKAPEILDVPGRRLATLYAGIGGHDPLSEHDLINQLEKLRPHYDKAVKLLERFQQEHNV